MKFPQLSYNLKFPHIPRIIPARSFISLNHIEKSSFIFLGIILAINFFYPSTYSTKEENIRFELQKNPFQSTLHTTLAQSYVETNKDQAEYEFNLAQELQSTAPPIFPNILGLTTTSPRQIWEALQYQQDAVKASINHWGKIHTAFPDYQYAQIQLARLYAQSGDKEKATESIKEVMQRNPSSPIAQQLLDQIR